MQKIRYIKSIEPVSGAFSAGEQPINGFWYQSHYFEARDVAERFAATNGRIVREIEYAHGVFYRVDVPCPSWSAQT